jgi:hypothetical protein
MSDDRNGKRETNRWSNRSMESAESSGEETDDEGATRAEWVNLPHDPEPEALGYEAHDWESFRALDGSDQVMFLPAEESALRDDEFIVVDEDSLLELGGDC